MLRQALGRFKSALLALLGYACLAAAEAPPKALVLADFALIDEMAEFTSEARHVSNEV
jgi:hypothetical protein